MPDALAQSPLPKSRPARSSGVLKNMYFARSRAASPPPARPPTPPAARLRSTPSRLSPDISPGTLRPRRARRRLAVDQEGDRNRCAGRQLAARVFLLFVFCAGYVVERDWLPFIAWRRDEPTLNYGPASCCELLQRLAIAAGMWAHFFCLFIPAYSLSRLWRRIFCPGCPHTGGTLQAPVCPPPRPIPRKRKAHQRNYKRKHKGKRDPPLILSNGCHETRRGEEQR